VFSAAGQWSVLASGQRWTSGQLLFCSVTDNMNYSNAVTVSKYIMYHKAANDPLVCFLVV